MTQARSLYRRERLLLIIGLALLAMLPPAWLAPWSADVAAIVLAPLRPVEWSLGRLRAAVRPASVADAFVEERLRELTDEREHYRGLWFAERLRTGDLEQRLEAVESVRRLDRSGTRPISATVISQSAGSGSRMLVVDAGRDAGVQAGDPVVTRGDRLMGRIADEPSQGHALLVPVNHPMIGRIDAVVEPGSAIEGHSDGDAAFVPIQLTPLVTGGFVGEMAAGGKVVVGDVVRLSDPTWKRAAQGMRLGTVRSIRPFDQNPLRLRLEVESAIEVERASNVVIKCEDTP